MSSTITALTSGGGLAMAGDTSGQLELKTNNGTTAVTIGTDQTVNVAKGIQLATGASGLYAVDGALSNYASNNGVSLNGNSAGWLRLGNDGTQSTKINLNGAFYGTPNQIEMFSNSLQRFTIASNGTMTAGAGGTSSTFDGVLNLNGSATTNRGAWIQFQSNGTTGSQIGTYSAVKSGTSTELTCMNTSGGVYLSGAGATSWSSASDERLKDITGTYTNALNDIVKIKPVKFTWKDDADKNPCVGVIAQSVENIVPEAIGKATAIKDDPTEYLSVRYTELIPLMISAIQELKAEVDALKGVK